MAESGIISSSQPSDAPLFIEHDIVRTQFNYDGDDSKYMWWKYVASRNGVITFDVALTSADFVEFEVYGGSSYWSQYVDFCRYGVRVREGDTVWIKVRGYLTKSEGGFNFTSVEDIWENYGGGIYKTYYPDWSDFYSLVLSIYPNDQAFIDATNSSGATVTPIHGTFSLVVRSSDLGQIEFQTIKQTIEKTYDSQEWAQYPWVNRPCWIEPDAPGLYVGHAPRYFRSRRHITDTFGFSWTGTGFNWMTEYNKSGAWSNGGARPTHNEMISFAQSCWEISKKALSRQYGQYEPLYRSSGGFESLVQTYLNKILWSGSSGEDGWRVPTSASYMGLENDGIGSSRENSYYGNVGWSASYSFKSAWHSYEWNDGSFGISTAYACASFSRKAAQAKANVFMFPEPPAVEGMQLASTGTPTLKAVHVAPTCAIDQSPRTSANRDGSSGSYDSIGNDWQITDYGPRKPIHWYVKPVEYRDIDGEKWGISYPSTSGGTLQAWTTFGGIDEFLAGATHLTVYQEGVAPWIELPLQDQGEAKEALSAGTRSGLVFLGVHEDLFSESMPDGISGFNFYYGLGHPESEFTNEVLINRREGDKLIFKLTFELERVYESSSVVWPPVWEEVIEGEFDLTRAIFARRPNTG